MICSSTIGRCTTTPTSTTLPPQPPAPPDPIVFSWPTPSVAKLARTRYGRRTPCRIFRTKVIIWFLDGIASDGISGDVRSEAQLAASTSFFLYRKPIRFRGNRSAGPFWGATCGQMLRPTKDALLAITTNHADVAIAPTGAAVTDQNAPFSTQQRMAHPFRVDSSFWHYPRR